MTAQATNTPISTPLFDRIKVNMKRGWSRYVIVRQMEGVRIAARHLGDIPELKTRMVELRAELSNV